MCSVHLNFLLDDQPFELHERPIFVKRPNNDWAMVRFVASRCLCLAIRVFANRILTKRTSHAAAKIKVPFSSNGRLACEGESCRLTITKWTDKALVDVTKSGRTLNDGFREPLDTSTMMRSFFTQSRVHPLHCIIFLPWIVFWEEPLFLY